MIWELWAIISPIDTTSWAARAAPPRRSPGQQREGDNMNWLALLLQYAAPVLTGVTTAETVLGAEASRASKLQKATDVAIAEYTNVGTTVPPNAVPMVQGGIALTVGIFNFLGLFKHKNPVTKPVVVAAPLAGPPTA